MAAEPLLERQIGSLGQAPGTLNIPSNAHPPVVHVVLYDRETHEKRNVDDVESLRGLDEDGRNVWVDVNGLGDKKLLEKLIDIFRVPWLAMEDVLHSPHRPKVDAYDDARFIIARMFDRPGTCDTDQLSIFARGRVVLTFQERPGDPFDPIRQRLAHKDSQLRQRNADYLVYRLVDACVDSMFPEVQRLSEDVQQVEEDAMEKPTPKVLHDLHSLRRDLRLLERVALATREAMSALARDEEGFFEQATKPYLRDAYDHATQVVEHAHFYTSVANDIGQFVIGTLDMKMNQVMKILAGVTVVLMPLTVITGVYGMNFEHMPELKWEWGYFGVLGVMVVLAVAVTLWMRRTGWDPQRAGLGPRVKEHEPLTTFRGGADAEFEDVQRGDEAATVAFLERLARGGRLR